MTARRPNILLVVSDHHSGYAFGPNSGVETPHMLRLAAEGLSFTELRTPCPMCAPARAGLMSALYPHANGMWNNNHTRAAMRRDLVPGVRLWSENLADDGYRLRYVGKWHVSAERSPARFGWEEFQPAPPPADRLSHVDVLRQEREGWPPRVVYATSTGPVEAINDARVTSTAVECIEAGARDAEPWCLFVGWTHPHDPYVAHERYLARYAPGSVRPPANASDALVDKPNIYRRLHEQLWDQLSPAQLAETIRHYRAMITFLDDQLGRLLAALERSGQAEDTLVVYTSDHGDYAGAHGLFAKGVPAFDEAYRVPFVVRWPAGIQGAGREVDAFASLLDVGPTLLEAAGAPGLTDVHGRSLLPWLRGETPSAWPDAFHGEFLGHENLYTQRLVRTRRHKYVWNAFDYDELYDLEADPHEMVNRVADPACDGARRELIRRIWDWVDATDDVIRGGTYPMNAILPLGPRLEAARTVAGGTKETNGG